MFTRVGERVEDQIKNMLIGQRIQNVFAFAAAGDEVFGAQDAKALGDGGEAFLFGFGEFGDAGFALGEEGEEAEAGDVADGAEQAGGRFEGILIDGGDAAAAGFVVVGSAGWVFHHFNTCSSVRRVEGFVKEQEIPCAQCFP